MPYGHHQWCTDHRLGVHALRTQCVSRAGWEMGLVTGQSRKRRNQESEKQVSGKEVEDTQAWRHVRTQDGVELRGPRMVEKGPLVGWQWQDHRWWLKLQGLTLPFWGQTPKPKLSQGTGPSCLFQFLGALASLGLGPHHP